jgi:uncharacterized protein (TIGR00725 family)
MTERAPPYGAAAHERPLRVAVIGAGDAAPELERSAYELGRALGEAGAVVVTGGLGGVMAAAAKGCHEAGGVSIGLLPGVHPEDANRWVDLPLSTGLGEGRNILVVRSAEAVVAVGGGWGTLSEIALAGKIGRPVTLLGPPAVDGLGLPVAATPAEAAVWALAAAGEGRRRGG